MSRVASGRIRAVAGSPAVLPLVVAATFVLIGLWAIATLSLTELYADQWRHYVVHLQHPFPQNVLIADNGHRSVFPALIRVIELHWLDGNQVLQLLTGALFALAALGIVAVIAVRDRSQPVYVRTAAIALTAFALFWLGNARMLLHGNESANIYPIMASLLAALALVLPWRAAVAGPGRLLVACLLGFIATFSFGPGLAVFVAVAMVLVIQRHYRAAAMIVIGLAATFALYVLAPGGDGVRSTLDVRPVQNLHAAAVWLTSMWAHLLSPFTQVGAGTSLPPGMRDLAQSMAVGYESMFGGVYENTGPFAVIGAIAMASLWWMSWRTWHAPASSSRLRLLGLGMAWFAFAVAGIVSLGRLGYFDVHPGQILANRYLPWSCLFWCGLLIAAVAGAGRTDRLPAGRAFAMAVVTLALVLGLLTTRGNVIWAGIVQDGVRVDSAGFVSGVIERDRSLGETVYDEVVAGIGPIRQAGLSAFAWPEAGQVGRSAAITTRQAGIEVARYEAIEVDNRLGGRAMRIDVAFRRVADIDMPPRLLVTLGSRVVGVAVRRATGEGWRYSGYANDRADAGEYGLARWRPDGGAECWHRCGAITVRR